MVGTFNLPREMVFSAGKARAAGNRTRHESKRRRAVRDMGNSKLLKTIRMGRRHSFTKLLTCLTYFCPQFIRFAA
jgi:hypothetical protein